MDILTTYKIAYGSNQPFSDTDIDAGDFLLVCV